MNMVTVYEHDDSSLHLKIHELNNDSTLQCSCLENPIDRGAWWATVQEVAKDLTRLRD